MVKLLRGKHTNHEQTLARSSPAKTSHNMENIHVTGLATARHEQSPNDLSALAQHEGHESNSALNAGSVAAKNVSAASNSVGKRFP